MRKIIYFTEEIDYEKTDTYTVAHEGWFHRFKDDLFAIIENTDGRICTVDVADIKFVLTPEEELWEQRRYEIAREQMAHGVIPRMAVNDADCLIEVLKGKSK